MEEVRNNQCRFYIQSQVTHVLLSKFNPANKHKDDGVKDEKEMLNEAGHGHSHNIPTKIIAGGGFEVLRIQLSFFPLFLFLSYFPEPSCLQAALRGFLVVLAISLHAVFEGIAMGLTDNTK